MKKMTIKLVNQPTGNSCGPTCLYMINNSLFGNEHQSIDEISTACGTDWIVGTPPDRLEKGLKYLGVNYIHHQNILRPFEKLVDLINIGNVCVLRTITKQVPHWIIIDNFEDIDGKLIFNVIDPWLGYLKYNVDDLEGIWKQREYECFEIVIQ